MSYENEFDEEDFYSDESLDKIDEDSLSSEKPNVTSTLDNLESNNEEFEEETDVEPVTYTYDSGGIELEVEDAEEIQPKTYTYDSGGVELEMEDDDSEDDVLTPEERLRGFADRIMSCCIGNKSIKHSALDKLMSVSSPMLFRDENFILFSVFYTYRGKLKRINIDEEFLKLFLNRNRSLLEKSRNFIDINAYGEIDGSVELGYISGVIKHFKRLVSMEELSEVEFETYFEKYLIEYKTLETQKTLNQAQVILTEGMTIGRKKYFGFEDSSSYLRRRLAEIEGVADMQKGSGFITARELLLEEKPQNKSYKISDFDELTALNDIFGGIYTGMFYQFIAPPKAGKTKLCARITHTTAIKYGNNVTVWAQEGGKEAFLAQLRAIHFDYMFNTGVGVAEKKFGVSQEAILHDNYPNEELKQLEVSSKLDLASNHDYGSIDFVDKPFEVETLLDDIDTSVKSNNSTMVVIDYLQLIDSCTNLSDRERVAKAYKSVLKYCKANNIAVISPGQYKQEVLDRLIQSGTANAEMRTAGGSSAEVTRTPDVIFAIWASTQDLLNNVAKILPMPCRFNKVFPEIPIVMDLETCHFISQ